MTARGIRYNAIKLIAVLLCTLMILPAVFSLLSTSSSALTNEISDCDFSDIGEVYYAPKGAKPIPKIKYGEYVLSLGKDFTVGYKDNKAPGTATVIINGTGNFYGSVEKAFAIKARPIEQTEITVSDVFALSETPKVGVSAEGRYFKEGTDFTVSYRKNTNGTVIATVTGAGNLTGSREITFNVMGIPITQGEISLADAVYTGEALGSEVTVSCLGKELVLNTDFIVSYENNINVGTGIATITGIGSYGGIISKQFNITPADISKGSIDAVFSEDFSSYEIKVKYGDIVLVKDTDYTIAVTEEENYANVTVTGIGNYSGTLTDSVKISDMTILDMAQVTAIPDQIYTGEYIRPEVILTYNGVELIYGTDYYLTFENNVNAGTTIITVTGIGSSAGTVREIPFDILPLDISNCKLLCDNTTYTGAELTPLPTITFGNYTLQNETDYIINSYSNNIEAGNGSMSVSGTGNYCGTANIPFVIVRKDDEQDKVKTRLDEMMEGLHDRQINDYMHSYKLGNYYNIYMTSACTCHSYCATGYESGCACLIGRSTVLGNNGIQCAGFTMEVFEYLFGKTNGAGENTLTTYNRSENEWSEEAIKNWMITSFRPGDYMAYDNITYGYPHYITIYSVESDGIWVYEANYGGKCKINFRKMTYTEIYSQLDGIYHRTPNNYELSDA